MQNTAKAEQKAGKMVDTRPVLTARWRALEGKGWKFWPISHDDCKWLMARDGMGRYHTIHYVCTPWLEERESETLELCEYWEKQDNPQS